LWISENINPKTKKKTYQIKRRYDKLITRTQSGHGRGKRMLAIERKNEILAILQKEQRVLVSELSKKYDVTDETIRRDLEKLESEGYVKRTYGGAVLNKNTNVDMPLRIREKTNRNEKEIIAKLVAELIDDGDRLMLDASSTSLMIAKEMKNKSKLTVITNSVEVLIELAGHEGIQVISTGGNLNETSLSLVGNAAQKVLNGYHVDKAVMSCKGIDMVNGLTDSNELDSDIKNVMYSCADTAVLAVDSSKFDCVSFVKTMQLKRGDILVTDRDPGTEWTAFLQEQGVRLVIPGNQ
jgi:DeoR/GlpR family transcriptional regulator of sugar metabolism